jgi:hypothetical protein
MIIHPLHHAKALMKHLFLLPLALLCLGATGCASRAPAPVTVPSVEAKNPTAVTVTVTSSVGASVANPNEYKSALVQSMAQSGLFTGEGSGGPSVTVDLVSSDEPWGGMSVAVTLKTSWQAVIQGKTVTNSISATGEAGISDSVIFVNRLAAAYQRAAQSTISQGITWLAAQGIATK